MFRQRGGRKLIVAPDGSTTQAAPRSQTVNALVKALAQAHRWQWEGQRRELLTVA